MVPRDQQDTSYCGTVETESSFFTSETVVGKTHCYMKTTAEANAKNEGMLPLLQILLFSIAGNQTMFSVSQSEMSILAYFCTHERLHVLTFAISFLRHIWRHKSSKVMKMKSVLHLASTRHCVCIHERPSPPTHTSSRGQGDEHSVSVYTCSVFLCTFL